MSAKRPSLAESMRAVAEEPNLAAPAPPVPTPAHSVKAEPSTEARPKAFFAATRAGKKKATTTLSSEAHRQLKLLAVDHGGVEALLNEAINDLFRKYGQPPLA